MRMTGCVMYEASNTKADLFPQLCGSSNSILLQDLKRVWQRRLKRKRKWISLKHGQMDGQGKRKAVGVKSAMDSEK